MEALGIGCICFSRKPPANGSEDQNYSPANHLKEIEQALESVDNVSNVRVIGHGNTISGIGFLDDAEEEEIFDPIYHDVAIEFDIFVPIRLQEKYALGRTADGVEAFHVKVYYDRMPVAYVHYTVAGNASKSRDYSPSTAIVFIRKYLAEKLKDHPTVQFDMLGPSPLWADLFVELAAAPDKQDTAQDMSSPGDGYRTFHFLSAKTEANDAIHEFISDYQNILSTFYLLVRARNNSRQLSEAVTQGALQLLQPPENAAPWARYNHWRKISGQIDSVYRSLLAEKLNRVNVASFFSNLKDDEELAPENIFYRFVEKEMQSPDPLPDEDIRELLIMLEERRRGYFQNSATLFSGLAGGILGALLGAALTYQLSSPPGASPSVSNKPAATSNAAIK